MKLVNLLVVGLCAMVASNSALTANAVVTNGNNDGAGSLRAALESGATKISIKPSVQIIEITETLSYNNNVELQILGKGQTINATAIDPNTDILSINGSGDVLISNLKFIGSFDYVNQDPLFPVGGKGIEVNVPVDATGDITVELKDIFLTQVGHHGIHISDCSFGDDCGGGSGGGGDGSVASVVVEAHNIEINQVGFGRADADGLRVDERGDGDIYFTAIDSVFANVGADGVELDEGNNGSVISNVNNSIFNRNGEYCNLVASFENSPCDDDGERDLDDGFDIDEAGEGDLVSLVVNSEVTYNFDEGLDFDEEDNGNIDSVIINTKGIGNQDEAFKMSEEGNGDLKALLKKIYTFDNNGKKEGIELEEADNGNVNVRVINSVMVGGDKEVLKVEQEDEGKGKLVVRNSALGGLKLENVEQK